jgi:uncharacterized damage-inducible protein DinB
MTSPTWTAPALDRTDFPLVAGEREALEHMLESHRETLLWRIAGLTAEQLSVRSVPPSQLSLLGLLRHLTEVERIWFLERVAGEPRELIYKTEENKDADFDDLDAVDAEAVHTAYRQVVARAAAAATGRSLDETWTATTRSGDVLTFDLRWVFLHMIEEYARHLGHADLLRECVDGTTGA